MSLQPSKFYSLDNRWFDYFADSNPGLIGNSNVGAFNRDYLAAKFARNEAYARWQASFFTRTPEGEIAPLIKPKMMTWQAIRILSDKHSETSQKDWWKNYQDCVFRVFVQPETFYEKETGEYKQWYLLSPEDSYLVLANELEKAGNQVPNRDFRGRERYLSADKRLRKALLVPVECAHHLRHETTAGVLPDGL